MAIKDCIAVALFGIWCLFASPSQAGPLNEQQAASIYALVYSHTHMPLPEHPPTIHMTSKEAIEAKLVEIGVCPKGCPSVKAAQIDEDIYVDDALDFSDIQNAAILFHEMVHYFQYAKDGPAKTCEEWRDREIYAYQAQNFVLNKAGARMVQAPTMPSCPGDATRKTPLPSHVAPLEKRTIWRQSFYALNNSNRVTVRSIPFHVQP